MKISYLKIQNTQYLGIPSPFFILFELLRVKTLDENIINICDPNALFQIFGEK